jgi:thiol-disulfide isomerase/thioredoxin
VTGDGLRVSRRAALSGLAGAAISSSARARIVPLPDAPPSLLAIGAQFVEIRPLVEPPPLKLERIDGKTVALNGFRGKVVLVSFWATWCPPCRRELPMLERLGRIADPRDLEIVPVSIDRAGKPAVAAFLKSAGVTQLRPFLDPEGRIARRAGDDASAPFVLYGMPISYVIDARGRVAGYVAGETDWTSAEALALLKFYRDV